MSALGRPPSSQHNASNFIQLRKRIAKITP
jgi:hypothetical protein